LYLKKLRGKINDAAEGPQGNKKKKSFVKSRKAHRGLRKERAAGNFKLKQGRGKGANPIDKLKEGGNSRENESRIFGKKKIPQSEVTVRDLA